MTDEEASADTDVDKREGNDDEKPRVQSTGAVVVAPSSVVEGGPEPNNPSALPPLVESLLCWTCFLFCPAAYGLGYARSVLLSSRWCNRLRRRALGLAGSLRPRLGSDRKDRALPPDDETDEPWIPLTTHSRAELDRCSSPERYRSLVRALERRHPSVLAPTEPDLHGRGADPTRRDFVSREYSADAALVRALRGDGVCRRLASLSMRPYDDPSTGCTTSLLRQYPDDPLLRRMARLWRHLLALPTLEEAKRYRRLPLTGVQPLVASAEVEGHCPYRISLVLPAYREDGGEVRHRLAGALEAAENPSDVEVVIVDAGGCRGLDMLLSPSGSAQGHSDGRRSGGRHWGRLAVYRFTSGGGRGPCLNFGASVSTGRILTFCHSDTTLPRHWDAKIVATLERGGLDGDRSSSRVNSCAFSFGVDVEGLASEHEPCTAVCRLPGIGSLEAAVNVRSRLFSLPYGDQAPSLHARVFDFLGGFPDQCLMEDFELTSLLRRREALFRPPSDAPGGVAREKVAIVPGPPALCSPRRWQKFGVFHVSYMNTRFVNLYSGPRRMGPDELFTLYYGKKTPDRAVSESPWEVELSQCLKC
ncbi:hypothetical protein ACHAWF_004444 [Thalassiosira exigua]